MGIKYGSQTRSQQVGKVIPISNSPAFTGNNNRVRLEHDQLLAIVAASIFSTGDCTLEWAVSRAKTLIALARDNANQ